MPDNIRVGLIRCDTHGAYYAPLMTGHDPVLLDQPVPMSEPDRIHYSWMAGGSHFYFYTAYANPLEMTIPQVEGFELVKVWDETRGAAELLAEVCHGRPQVCDTFEDVSDDVDLVFIADCNYDGSDHLKLARPGLEKGVATFIDKPMAADWGDVETILALSDRHGAPVHSMSILGALPDTHRFHQRLPEVGAIQFGTIEGGGTEMAGSIHAVALALTVFGSGVRHVRCMGQHPREIVHLSWDDAPDRPTAGVTINGSVGSPYRCAFYAEAYGPEGAIQSRPLNDDVFPFGAVEILRQVKRMVKTGRRIPELALMLEAVAVTDAATAAHTSGAEVAVSDTWRSAVAEA